MFSCTTNSVIFREAQHYSMAISQVTIKIHNRSIQKGSQKTLNISCAGLKIITYIKYYI